MTSKVIWAERALSRGEVASGQEDQSHCIAKQQETFVRRGGGVVLLATLGVAALAESSCRAAGPAPTPCTRRRIRPRQPV
jgi:hypothetical protein